MHFRYSKIVHGLALVAVAYFLVFLVGDCSVQAQSTDTTVTASVHPAKVKPKKIKKRRAVYKLQSQSVADALGLNKQQSDTLEVLYREARKSRKMAAYKTKADEISIVERGKLGIALRKIMTEEQAAEAMPVLGGFNPHWDNFVFLISTFKLEKEKKSEARQLVLRYLVVSEKEKKGSKSGGSRSSTNLKASLDAGMADLLTNDQMSEWNESTNRVKKEKETSHREVTRNPNPRKGTSIKQPQDPFRTTKGYDPARTSMRSRFH